MITGVGGVAMCCLRFDADVLLANVYGSSRYKKDMEIRIVEFLKDYTNYLDSIFPGYKFYSKSKEDIDEVVRQYRGIFKWKENEKVLETKGKTLNPDFFNQSYPENIGEKLRFAADICLGVWELKQENEKKLVENGTMELA
jgi:hypothetical protein